MVTVAAYTFAALILVVSAFQLALAAGAPWGHLAMGGKFPGRFPPTLRVAALVQLALLVAFAAIVLIRSGLLLPEWQATSRVLIWIVVGFSALSLAMNLATPSRWERILWAPVAAGMTATSTIVALGA